MSLSPSSILARLDELKKWQEQQQERLMQQHHKRLEQNENRCNFAVSSILSENALEVNSPHDRQSSSKKLTFWNDQPKSFKSELNELAVQLPKEKTKNATKKSFLKKGAGLARYRMNPGEQFRYSKDIKKTLNRHIKEGNVPCRKQNIDPTEKENICNFETVSNLPPNITPLKKPDISFKPKAKWFRITDEEQKLLNSDTVEGKELDVPIKQPLLNTASSKLVLNKSSPSKVTNTIVSARQNVIKHINMYSMQKAAEKGNPKTEKLQEQNELSEKTSEGDLTLYEKAQERELRIFEALEQKAMNSSFSSTNSSVVRLLASTPCKNGKQENRVTVGRCEVYEFSTCNGNNINPETRNEPDLIRFESEEVPKVDSENVQNEHQHFEQQSSLLSEQSEVSIRSSDLRSLLERFIPKIQKNNPDFFGSSLPDKNYEIDKSRKYFEDNLFKDFPSDSSITSEDIQNKEKECNDSEIEDDHTVCAREFNDNEKWSDDDKESSSHHNTSLESFKSGEAEINVVKSFLDAATMTDLLSQEKADIMTKNVTETPENALVEKLQELEQEIAKFRDENAKVAKIKRELEVEQLDFRKKCKQKLKEVEEEKIMLKDQLEEERKKLAKEKMVFERYIKDSQNRPSKKEREEITLLKSEIANLKETLKLKETKNGMTQARLRNQIKRLEKDNSELKEQIENLQKQNARLLASQKLMRTPSDTKMLHEINKNLTKLALDSKIAEKNKKYSRKKNYVESSSESSELSDNSLEREIEHGNKNMKTKKRTQSLNDIETLNCEHLSNIKNKEKANLSLKGNKEKCSNMVSNFSNQIENGNNTKDLPDSIRENNEKSNTPNYTKSCLALCRDKFGETVNEKENNRNFSNMEDKGSFRSFSDLSIEKQYERLFGNNSHEIPEQITNNDLDDTNKTTGRVEQVLSDGSKEIKYSNGNVKTISEDGNFVVMKYYNGDIKETNLLEGSIRYYYKENRIWHTTYADGTELLEFPNGQKEQKFKDGSYKITYDDGTIREIDTLNTERISYADGTIVTIKSNGDKIMELPNGQREIHTKEHKRREYPDGTVKIIYPDGSQETRYANGRIRIKDRYGTLLMDSEEVGKSGT